MTSALEVDKSSSGMAIRNFSSAKQHQMLNRKFDHPVFLVAENNSTTSTNYEDGWLG